MADTFSPYQIDYSVKNTSRTFGFSKKKITFRFGVANPPAVEAGEAGANCRGSEHEIIFTWSLNSGKRQILADGKDVHYSETGQNGWTADQVFQHHFNIRVSGLSGPLRAHLITQPANRDLHQIKPFDLRINGVSYFSMPKIFQLGTPQMITRPVKGKGKNRGGGGGGGNSSSRGSEHLSHQEREAIAAAKLASLQDQQVSHNQQEHSSSGFASAPANDVNEDLFSFDAPPAAAAAPPLAQGGASYGQPPPQQQYSNYSLGASITTSVQSSPHPSRGSFSSQVSQQSQLLPPQQQQQQQHGMMGSVYGQQPQPPQQQLYYGQQPQAPPQAQPPQPPQQQLVQPQQGSLYGQPPPASLHQQGSMYGQQQPSTLAPALFDPQQASLTSPSNQTQVSYQSYGSAPSFAQPPQQQIQQSQQVPYYGQPPPAQGYP